MGDGEGSAEQFTGAGGAVLWEWGSGQYKISFGEQIFQGGEFGSMRHGFTIKRVLAKSNRSLFFVNAHFRHYPASIAVDNDAIGTVNDGVSLAPEFRAEIAMAKEQNSKRAQG